MSDNLPMVPIYTVDEIQRIGETIARSNLFGVKTVEQAVTLCLIAQAEGRHPALAARDYDIIEGRPAKKAEAMLRDFIASSGRVEWHELTDEAADATFSHPSGGTVRIRWDMARARKAGVGSKPMYQKYPRQMLRSRTVSEGIRTVCPSATSGMYVPEEVQDFRETIEAPPRPQREQFQVPLEQRARAAAADGTESLNVFWKALSKAEKDEIAYLIGFGKGKDFEPGELTLMARAADATPEQAQEPPQRPGTAERERVWTEEPRRRGRPPKEKPDPLPDAAAPAVSSQTQGVHAGSPAPASIETPGNYAAQAMTDQVGPPAQSQVDREGPPEASAERHRSNAPPVAKQPRSSIWEESSFEVAPMPADLSGDINWKKWGDDVRFLVEEATPDEKKKLWADNQEHLNMLRRRDGDVYRAVVEAFQAEQEVKP